MMVPNADSGPIAMAVDVLHVVPFAVGLPDIFRGIGGFRLDQVYRISVWRLDRRGFNRKDCCLFPLRVIGKDGSAPRCEGSKGVRVSSPYTGIVALEREKSVRSKGREARRPCRSPRRNARYKKTA
jgi:hypothetical protein